MRYIRTNDNEIYETTEYYMLPLGYPEYRVKGSNKAFSEYTDVVKQADTIEELCDEFVVIGKTTDDYSTYDNLNKALKFMELRGICRDRLRGAIWTDKGLIYVARMNNEGVMELL